MKTTGLSETDVEWQGQALRVCDTGGQRSERGKWVRIFPFVSCVVFVVSLSEYDQVLVEASDQVGVHSLILRLFFEKFF